MVRSIIDSFVLKTILCVLYRKASVNRILNKEIIDLTKSMKEVFEALEKNCEPTLQLVAPSYYLLQRKLQAILRECRSITLFQAKLSKQIDDKYWTSVKAIHWIACFLDPTFKSLNFVPQTTCDDSKFKRELMNDLDKWILDEMSVVEDKLNALTTTTSDNRCTIHIQCMF